MKKTLIASAIAAAALSTSAFAMDQATDIAERLDSMPTVYGNIQLAHVSNDNEFPKNLAGTGGIDGQNGTFQEYGYAVGEESDNKLGDNGSTIGIKHKHAITEDLEGFMKAELEFEADDKDGSGGLHKLDEAYIGVKGEFGSIQAGSDDTVYEWVDMMDTVEAVGIAGEIAELKEGDNLQYESPMIMDSLTLGVTAPVDSDSNFGGALAAKYARDNFTVAFAYGMGREDAGVEAADTWGLAGSIALDDLTFIAQFESKDESTNGADDSEDFLGLQAKYTMGANRFKLGYGMTSYDDADATEIEFQALHNLSSNMYVYLEYVTVDIDVDGAGDDPDGNAMAIGATYNF